MKYTMCVLVENAAGVLSKVSGLFSRRGFNIESLAVGVTENPTVSRITLIADGDEYVVEQLEKQLNKLIPVIKVKTFETGEFYSRELILAKVACTAGNREQILKIAENFRASIIDGDSDTISLEFSDTIDRVESFLSVLRPLGIRETVRTGLIAMEKGSGITAPKKAQIY